MAIVKCKAGLEAQHPNSCPYLHSARTPFAAGGWGGAILHGQIKDTAGSSGDTGVFGMVCNVCQLQLSGWHMERPGCPKHICPIPLPRTCCDACRLLPALPVSST